MGGGWRHPRPRQEFRIMLDDRLGLEAQILGIIADHLQRFQALRKPGEVAVLDRSHVVRMNAGGFARRIDRLTALLALALKVPPGLAGRIELAIRSSPVERRLSLLDGGPVAVIDLPSVH